MLGNGSVIASLLAGSNLGDYQMLDCSADGRSIDGLIGSGINSWPNQSSRRSGGEMRSLGREGRDIDSAGCLNTRCVGEFEGCAMVRRVYLNCSDLLGGFGCCWRNAAMAQQLD